MLRVRKPVVEAVRSVIEPLEIRRLLASVVKTEFDPSGTDQRINVTVNPAVAGSMASGDLTAISLQTGNFLTTQYLGASTGGTVATWKTSATLPDGWYETYVRSGALVQADNDYEETFSFLNADFNQDKVVDFNDFLVLQNNFGQSGKRFSDGDANYDGTVDFNDFLVLQNNFGQSVPDLLAKAGGVVVAKTGPNTLDIGWTPDAGPRDGFNVYRSDDGGATYALVKTIADPDARIWTDNIGLQNGQTYWYRVRSYKGSVVSASTSKASGTPTATQVIPIGAETATAVGISSSSVLVSWTSSVVYSGQFKIERSTDPYFQTSTTVVTNLPSGTISYVDTGLTDNTQYYYRVTALTGTLPTPTVAAAQTLVLGAAPISVNALGGDGGADSAGGTAEGADGGDPMAMSYSGGAVRYADGREFFSTTDLDPADSGVISGLTRTWSSDPIITQASARFGLGNGWIISQIPTLVRPDADTIAVVQGGQAVQWFDKSNGAWVARYFGKDNLAEPGNNTFKLTDTEGNFATFDSAGRVLKWTDAGGNETSYSYANGTTFKPTSIVRRQGTTTVLEQLAFGYDVAGRLASVTMSRPTQGQTSATPIRQVTYTYASSISAAASNVTDAIVSDPSSSGNSAVDRKYYGYDGNGRLQSVLEGALYERAAQTISNFATATAAALRQYTDLFFEFDAAGRLIKQLMQGIGTYQYQYGLLTPSQSPTNLNQWASQAVEYLPDPSLNTEQTWNDSVTGNDKNIVYSNLAGEVLAKSFVDLSGGSGLTWTQAYQYDPLGQLTLAAEPSAVSGAPNAANSDIVSPILRANAGLLHVYSYFPVSSPTAPGYLSGTSVQKGTAATPIALADFQYTQRPNSPGWLASSSTVYRSVGADPATTTFGYAFYPTKAQVQTATTTLPSVTPAQNGDNSTTQVLTTYDTFGRPVWTRDGDGYVNFAKYDNATGSATQVIVDADPSAVTGAAVAGPGRTAADVALTLQTDITVDQLGRTVWERDPMLHVTTTAYVDKSNYDTVTTTLPSTSGSGTSLPPVMVTRNERAKGEIDVIRLTAAGAVSSLSINRLNSQGQITARDRYASVGSLTYSANTGIGGADAFYHDTYVYDGRGRRTFVSAARELNSASPTPTVTQTDYDALDRPIATWIGTNQAVSGNMTKVASMEYDNGAVGDGNLTRTTQYVDTNASNNRVTQNAYDWRDRLVANKVGVQGSEATDVNRPIQYVKYDNLDRPIATFVFDGDGVSVIDANSDGVPDVPAASLARSASLSQYDSRGRVYRTTVFDMNQASGLSSGGVYGYTDTQLLNVTDATLATLSGVRIDSWFDNRGNAVKSKAPGGVVTKNTYDGAGRLTRQATTDGGGDSTLADAKTLTGDAVLEQADFTLDKDGNTTLVATGQRHHDATTTGALTPGNARISFVGTWFDEADRPYITVNWGNHGDDGDSDSNGTVDFVRPSSAPARGSYDGWDPFLRTDTAYDEDGRVQDVISPRNIKEWHVYDALDRTTALWDNYVSLAGAVDSRKTATSYNGYDQVTQVATTTFGASPRTFINEYQYGVTKGTGVEINNSGLLSAVVYGRPAGVSGSNNVHKLLCTGYNAAGENTRTSEVVTFSASPTVTIRDHVYTYDVRGNQTRDEWVGAVPQTLADRGRVREFKFDTLGRGTLFTLKGSVGGAVINEVKRDYDGLGHLVREWQEHNGAVSGSTYSSENLYDTNDSTTASVAFSANRSRQVGVRDPNQHVVSYVYGYKDFNQASTFEAQLNDRISRVGFITDGTSTGTTGNNNRLEFYEYLGLGTLVERQAPRVKNTNNSYTTLFNSVIYDLDPGSGNVFTTLNFRDDAGTSDPYGGLDRFGRTVIYLAGADQRAYAYDVDGNVLSSWNPTNSNFRSELYQSSGATAATAYDGLGRIQTYRRGQFQTPTGSQIGRPTVITAGSNGVPQPSQSWSVASNGNYDRAPDTNTDPAVRGVYQRAVPTGSSGDVTDDLPENRPDVFIRFGGWGELAQKDQANLVKTTSDAGNGDQMYSYEYDIANAHSLAFAYDALGRRVTETDSDGSLADHNGVNHLFYAPGGQVIEERNENGGTIDAIADDHYTWSPADPGKLVAFDTDTDGSASGAYGQTLDERYWILQGPDGSTWSARTDGVSGNAGLEQFSYTTEGVVTSLSPIAGGFANNGERSLNALRYLWRSGRYDGDGIVLTPGGVEQDTHRGTPLGDDAYADATYVPGSFFTAENTEWATAQERFGGAGTQGQWSVPGTTYVPDKPNLPSTWDVWTDTTGKYDQWRPSKDWDADPHHIAAASRLVGIAALSVATAGLGTTLLVGGTGAVLGGIDSRLGGGSFASGAVGGAEFGMALAGSLSLLPAAAAWGAGVGLNVGLTGYGAYQSFSQGNNAQGAFRVATGAYFGLRQFGYDVNFAAEPGILTARLIPARIVKQAALRDMVFEDRAELSPEDSAFYSAPHRNSLQTLAEAEGYSLRNIRTGEVMKYGETTQGTNRYTRTYLNKIGARMWFEAQGSKLEMHQWQTDMIRAYKAANGGNRPLMNKTDY